jgi:hypothetical protein
MLWLALGALLLAGFVLLGRASSRPGGGGDWRVAGGLIAIAALVGAAVLAVRGSYLPAAALAFGALTAASLSRRPPTRPRRREPHKIAMSETEARAVLGVGPEADAEAVQAAYVRLMRRVHPDAGGAPGLAAQLNAARDRLLD